MGMAKRIDVGKLSEGAFQPERSFSPLLQKLGNHRICEHTGRYDQFEPSCLRICKAQIQR